MPKINIKIENYESKDFELFSGDILYNEDVNEYFQIIRLEQPAKYIIYNLGNHRYIDDNILSNDNMLMYSSVVNRINSRYADGNFKWEYVSKSNYELDIKVIK